jgi:membrane associated rhomboid family serine protease
MSVSILIIIFTSLISYQAFNDYSLFSKLKHFPYEEKREKSFYRLVTSGFIHGNFTHLLVNMLVLYFFGDFVEYTFTAKFGLVFGKVAFLIFYILIIVLADLPTYYKHKDNPRFSSVGASGAISGLVFTYILYNPLSSLYLYFIIPINAVVFGIGYLWYSSYMSKKSGDHIDHDAHFAGAISGIFISLLIQPQLLSRFFNQITSIF